MEKFFDQDVMSLKETSVYLDIPENVLRNWLEIRYKHIPCHIVGTGKKTGVCFFKPEINDWFNGNGGNYLRDKVVGRRDSDSRSKRQESRYKN